jgi:hypothetical protein
MAVLSPYFTEYMNKVGMKGLYLPVPTWTKDIIVDPTLKTSDVGYLVIEAMPSAST